MAAKKKTTKKASRPTPRGPDLTTMAAQVEAISAQVSAMNQALAMMVQHTAAGNTQTPAAPPKRWLQDGDSLILMNDVTSIGFLVFGDEAEDPADTLGSIRFEFIDSRAVTLMGDRPRRLYTALCDQVKGVQTSEPGVTVPGPDAQEIPPQ